MDILHLIDSLETEVTTSRKVPLSNAIIIDEKRLLDLIDQMRVTVPEDVREAHRIVQDKESVMSEASQEAKRIKDAAEGEAQARLQDTEVVKAAEKKAEGIIAEAQSQRDGILATAQAEAVRTKEEANKYVGDVLRRLETQLSTLLAGIQKGIEALDRGAER